MRALSLILTLSCLVTWADNQDTNSSSRFDFGPFDKCEMNLSGGPLSQAQMDDFSFLSKGLDTIYETKIKAFNIEDRQIFIRNALEIFNRELKFSRLFMRDRGTNTISDGAKNYAQKVFGTQLLDQQHFLVAMIYWLEVLTNDSKLPKELVQEVFMSMLSTYWDWQGHLGPTKYSLVMQAAYALTHELHERFDDYIFSDQKFLLEVWEKFYPEYSIIEDNGIYGHEYFINRLFSELFNDQYPFNTTNFSLESGTTYTIFANFINIRIRNLNEEQRKLLKIAPKIKETHCRLFRGQKVLAELVSQNFSKPEESIWRFTVVFGNPDSEKIKNLSQGEFAACPKALALEVTGIPEGFINSLHP
ncbi:MAG: hypothetical protein KA116_02485 [Proteobacteria bacterium]|nr:hypothetical protein [Pseudomonadota bacterium]